MGGEFEVLPVDFHLARVVGENDEGMTIFIPKAREGRFVVERDSKPRFLTVVFIRSVGNEGPSVYTPWRE